MLSIPPPCCLHLTEFPLAGTRLTWRDPTASQMGSELWVGSFSVRARDWMSPRVCEQEPQGCKKWGKLWWWKAEAFVPLSSAVQLKLWENTLFLSNNFQLQNKPLHLIKHKVCLTFLRRSLLYAFLWLWNVVASNLSRYILKFRVSVNCKAHHDPWQHSGWNVSGIIPINRYTCDWSGNCWNWEQEIK